MLERLQALLAGEGFDVPRKRQIPCSLVFSTFDPRFERNDEAAFSLVPEGVRIETLFDPDTAQGVPVPPYALGGFGFLSLAAGAKNPSMARPSAFSVAS